MMISARDAGTMGTRGAAAPLAFLARGARGAEVPFLSQSEKNLTSFIKKLDDKPVL